MALLIVVAASIMLDPENILIWLLIGLVAGFLGFEAVDWSWYGTYWG
jgi:hypothetical protein